MIAERELFSVPERKDNVSALIMAMIILAAGCAARFRNAQGSAEQLYDDRADER
jgi:hypothetical protein